MPASSARPTVRIVDTQGRYRTVARGPDAFVRLAHGQSWLVCGVGPDADAVECIEGNSGGNYRDISKGNNGDNGRSISEGDDVLWLESPHMHATWDALTPGWRERIPAQWREITPEDAPEYAHGRTVLLYRQGAQVDSDFWGPLLGRIQARLLCHSKEWIATSCVTPLRSVCTPRNDTGVCSCHCEEREAQSLPRAKRGGGNPFRPVVCLPGKATDLLHLELTQAFTESGCAVWSGDNLSSLLSSKPSLFFSVNLRGLDTAGETFHLLRACHVPVALWFVDNPWHILARLRLPWWKAAQLFVTDASFIPALKAAGAAHVYHLPLAYAPHMCVQAWTTSSPTPVLFVGRSAFPEKARFFAAARVSADLKREARTLLGCDARPDFHWWSQRCGVSLWPGFHVRDAGLGAEQCNALLRARWLTAALPLGLTVYGDADNWRALLPHAPARIFNAPVDYYTALPCLYATAPYTLNVTSLLLPAGLTQRHFDVWAGGGFLLTDPTPGLDIFPPELVREIRLPRAEDISVAVARFENEPALRRDIMNAWRTHILQEHGYAQRIARVWECCIG